MTTPATPAVEVIQADREAAAAVWAHVWKDTDKIDAIMRGALDQRSFIIQAFARHRIAAAVQRAGAPEGWVMVPREPTCQMLDAADEVFGMPWADVIPPGADPDRFVLSHAYAAMLAASPPPPEATRPDGAETSLAQRIQQMEDAAGLAKECFERATYLHAMEPEGLSTIERQAMETLYKAASALTPVSERG